MKKYKVNMKVKYLLLLLLLYINIINCTNFKGHYKNALKLSHHKNNEDIDLVGEVREFEIVDIKLSEDHNNDHQQHLLTSYNKNGQEVKHWTKLSLKHYKNERIPLHRDKVILSLTMYGDKHVLNLTRNDDIFADRFFVSHSDDEGKVHAEYEWENCHYTGHVQGVKFSTVILSTCNNEIRGHIKMLNDRYLIEPVSLHHESLKQLNTYSIKEHSHKNVIFRQTDMIDPKTHHCGMDDHENTPLKIQTVISNKDHHDHNHNHNHDHNHHKKTVYFENDYAKVIVHEANKKMDPISSSSSSSSSTITHTPTMKKKIDESDMSNKDNLPEVLNIDQDLNKKSNNISHGQHLDSCLSPKPNWIPKTGGCSCQAQWSFNGQCYSTCANPDNDAQGAWCLTTATCNGVNYDYCKAQTTTTCDFTAANPGSFGGYTPPSGCTCKSTWANSGKTYCGGICGNPDNDANGAWCFTTSTCNSNNYAYCTSSSAPAPAPSTCTPQTAAYVGMVPKTNGCTCKSTWANSGKTYCGGICDNPDNDAQGAWCFTSSTCNGVNYDYCKKPAGPAPAPTPAPTPAPPTSVPSNPVNHQGRTIELCVVVDTALYDLQSGTTVQEKKDNALAKVIRLITQVKKAYEEDTSISSYGIFVQLVAVHIFTSTSAETAVNLYTASGQTINTYLQRLVTFRTNYLNGKRDSNWNVCTGSPPACNDFSNDDTQLLTGSDRSGSTTGLAYMSATCGSYGCGVDEALLSEIYVGDTVAHELGHNMGANHDSDSNNCASSGYIMAAIGNTGIASPQVWSSCSVNYFATFLQNLEAQTSCLANAPRAAFTGFSPYCGDGQINQATEQCDLGTARNGASNENCDSICRLVGSVQCASGECCITGSGQFAGNSVNCRSATGDCDVRETCPGNSATCGTNFVKSNGATCSSAGPGSRCTDGTCIGYDAQCAKAFSGYTGVWVHGGRGNKLGTGSCESGCGELKCTNTQWDNYCYTYNCQSGYTCTVGGEQLNGPASKDICSCSTVQNAPSTIYVADYTPCSGNNVCISQTCTTRPSTAAGQGADTCNNDADCNNNPCAVALGATQKTCACQNGFYGTHCENKYNCITDCDSLNRVLCTTEAGQCGVCKTDYMSTYSTLKTYTPCDLAREIPAHIEGNQNLDSYPPANLHDNDRYLPWMANFDNSTHPSSYDQYIQEKLTVTWPFVTSNYTKAFNLRRYDVISSQLSPAMDPAAWFVEGSYDGLKWELLDTRTDIKFTARYQRQTFVVKHDYKFKYFRFIVTKIYGDQGGTNIVVNTTAVDAGSNTTNLETTVTNSTYIPQLAVGEVTYYDSASWSINDNNSSIVSAGIIVGLSVGGSILAIVVIVGLVVFVRKRQAQAIRMKVEKNTFGVASHTAARKPSISTAAVSISRAPMNQSALPSQNIQLGKRFSISYAGETSSFVHHPQPDNNTRAVEKTYHMPKANEWVEYTNDEGIPYYFNASTNESRWDNPNVK